MEDEEKFLNRARTRAYVFWARRISAIADSMAEREGFELSVLVVKLPDDVEM